MGLTSNPVVWDATRASGIVAYLMLTAVTLVGLSLSGRLRLERWPRFAIEDVHRFGGLLVGVFISIHVLTVAIDSYMPFSLGQLIVPFASDYKPLWTALGIVAAELLLALAVTNKLRRRLPYRFWRAAHMLNFAVWVAATGHGIAGGTDGRSPWLLGIYSGSIAAVLLAFAASRSSATTAKRAPLSTHSPSRQ